MAPSLLPLSTKKWLFTFIHLVWGLQSAHTHPSCLTKPHTSSGWALSAFGQQAWREVGESEGQVGGLGDGGVERKLGSTPTFWPGQVGGRRCWSEKKNVGELGFKGIDVSGPALKGEWLAF